MQAVGQYLSVWKVFPLHTEQLTDQTVRQNSLGPDCEWRSHRLDGHMVAQCSGSLDMSRQLLDLSMFLPWSASIQKLNGSDPTGGEYQGF